jgi:hypothetical protein
VENKGLNLRISAKEYALTICNIFRIPEKDFRYPKFSIKSLLLVVPFGPTCTSIVAILHSQKSKASFDSINLLEKKPLPTKLSMQPKFSLRHPQL